MLKTYQFKTRCKADIYSSKTANIILQGFMTKYRWTARPYVYEKSSIQIQWHDAFASMDAFEFEYDFVHIRTFTYIL